jgi:hypothetical protein
MSKSFTQFRVDNVTTTLPTTLEYGKEVYYKDASGNLTLWVGHEDGTAWPAVGYKEYVALISQGFTNPPVATVQIDTIGGSPVWSRSGVGVYVLTNAGKFTTGKKSLSASQRTSFLGDPIAEGIQLTVSETSPTQDICQLNLYEDGVANDGLSAYFFTIRIYP